MGQLVDREQLERETVDGRFVLRAGQVLSPAALELAQERGIDVVRARAGVGVNPSAGDLAERLARSITDRLVADGHRPGPELEEAVAAELGKMDHNPKDQASPAEERTRLLACLNCDVSRQERVGTRVLVSAAGRNRPGIVAGLAQTVALAYADIIEISQSLVGEYFTMAMVLDIASAQASFESIRDQLLKKGEEIGVHVAVMHDDILRSMHRI